MPPVYATTCVDAREGLGSGTARLDGSAPAPTAARAAVPKRVARSTQCRRQQRDPQPREYEGQRGATRSGTSLIALRGPLVCPGSDGRRAWLVPRHRWGITISNSCRTLVSRYADWVAASGLSSAWMAIVRRSRARVHRFRAASRLMPARAAAPSKSQSRRVGE